MKTSQNLRYDFDEMQKQLTNGAIPGYIYNDAGIYELEKERIFSKAWIAIGHESEISNPGDYVVRQVAEDSLIVARDNAGEISVHFNYCRHRGMQVCRAESGNASSFRCAYHGWVYRNTGQLTGVPFDKAIYGEKGLDRSQFGLVPVSKVGIYNGIIFVCFDQDVVPLEEYLGDMKWYLDLITKRTHGGLQVVGAPQRWVIEADWKLASENMIGDSYHTPTNHRSVSEIGVSAYQKEDLSGFKKQGVEVCAEPGATGFAKIPPGSFNYYPENQIKQFEECLTPDQFNLLKGGTFFEEGLFPTRAHVFPNLSFLNVRAPIINENSNPVPFLTMRIWQPVGPGKMEVISWVLVDKSAPDSFKASSQKSYVLSFGTSGMAEQDDGENWSNISFNVKGVKTRDFYQNVQMGIGKDQTHQIWPGPGKAYTSIYTEVGQRYFLTKWLEYMRKPI